MLSSLAVSSRACAALPPSMSLDTPADKNPFFAFGSSHSQHKSRFSYNKKVLLALATTQVSTTKSDCSMLSENFSPSASLSGRTHQHLMKLSRLVI
jgi:hypothetical protein